MPTPSPGRFRQADAILDAVLDLAPEERAHFVARACEGEPELRSLVLRLLRAFERSDHFLSGPAAELARPILEAAGAPDTEALPPAPPGVIGPYRILRELGRGGMGVVYLAIRQDDPTEALVALKTLQGGAQAAGDALRRFLAERRILATLDHPFVARLLESGITHDGIPYFAMAYCAGGSLADRLALGALAVNEAFRVGRQLAEALSAAHAVEILHRDVKPANVLFTAAGDVQLTDFGIAKLLDHDATQSGNLLGTPAYLAPEQLCGLGVDHRADLWALGVTLYQALAGRRPFDGSSYAAVMHAVLVEEPSPLGQVAAVPPAAAALVHHLLRKVPAERPQTAAEVAEALAAMESDPAAGYAFVDAVPTIRHVPSLDVSQAPVAALRSSATDGHFLPVHEHASKERPALWRSVSGLALVGLAIAIGLAATWWPRAKEPVALLAVGTIHDRGIPADDTAEAGPAVRGMLVTNLARLSGVQVVGQSRMLEVLARTGGSIEVAAEALVAARLAGATELIEGELEPDPGGGYLLELRRVDVARGSERAQTRLRAPDIETLLSQATSWVASAHGTVMPPASAGEVSSRSLIAQRRYEAGLEAFHQGSSAEAMRLYLAALEEDSTFLAPLYQLPLVWSGPGWEGMVARLGRAARAAGGAPELERLRMRYRWAVIAQDPSVLAIAESLATRYPSEPEAQLALGTALFNSGDFLGAIPHFRQAIAADSSLATYQTAAVPCQNCVARDYLIWAYSLADSNEAALREARTWFAAQSADQSWARRAMAAILEVLGRRDELLALVRVPNDDPGFPLFRLELELTSAIRAGNFTEVSRLMDTWRESPDSDMAGLSLYWQVIAERTRGRPASALAAAQQHCDRIRARSGSEPGQLDGCTLSRVSPLLELGNPLQAIRELRERLEERYPDSLGTPGLEARRRAWLLLHLGVALAAAGDTAALAAVADSLERTGRRSGYGRDRRMHHHLRGLLLQARGQHQQAIAEFRRAVWSPNQGYPRTHLELARELLRLGQPREAVATLEPLLRGPLAAMGSYTTQTEIRALLAVALDRAGDSPGAIAQMKWVEAAWADAEPPGRARLDSLRAMLRVPTQNP